jgi:hypothetical protein
MTTSELLQEIMSRPKASHASVIWQSFPTPAAEFKGHTLQKITSGVVRVGAEYRNLAPVKEAIENGERGEIQPPKGKVWETYPYVLRGIKDPSQRYLQVAGNTGGMIQRPRSEYFVDGVPTSKESFESMLRPSDRSGYGTPPLTWTIKLENILGIKMEGEMQMV